MMIPPSCRDAVRESFAPPFSLAPTTHLTSGLGTLGRLHKCALGIGESVAQFFDGKLVLLIA